MTAPMSLASRMERLQLHREENPDLENFRWLTTEEMGKDIVTFGKAHQGETFKHVWSNHRDWIKFMLKRYPNSQKVEHQKLFMYVDRMVEKEEIELGVVSDPDEEETEETAHGKGHGKPCQTKGNGKGKMTAAAKPKAKTRAAARPSDVPVELEELEEDSWDAVSEMNQGYNVEAENVQALQQRMLHMENALTEVIRHIQEKNN